MIECSNCGGQGIGPNDDGTGSLVCDLCKGNGMHVIAKDYLTAMYTAETSSYFTQGKFYAGFLTWDELHYVFCDDSSDEPDHNMTIDFFNRHFKKIGE